MPRGLAADGPMLEDSRAVRLTTAAPHVVCPPAHRQIRTSTGGGMTWFLAAWIAHWRIWSCSEHTVRATRAIVKALGLILDDLAAEGAPLPRVDART